MASSNAAGLVPIGGSAYSPPAIPVAVMPLVEQLLAGRRLDVRSGYLDFAGFQQIAKATSRTRDDDQRIYAVLRYCLAMGSGDTSFPDASFQVLDAAATAVRDSLWPDGANGAW
ncbi:hypothetical protein HY933_02370 [Candidatus Falkowbacteria bacterium]|nr:hypothetical protein [Candidatus Falkowbacteria bacterium]